MLNLSVAEQQQPVTVIKALKKYFGGSISVQAERTRLGRMYQNEGENVQSWEARVRQCAAYCEYDTFEDQAIRDRFIAGLIDEALQAKLNNNGHRDREGNIVLMRTVAEVAKNPETSMDTKRLTRLARSDQEQINWTRTNTNWKANNSGKNERSRTTPSSSAILRRPSQAVGVQILWFCSWTFP